MTGILKRFVPSIAAAGVLAASAWRARTGRVDQPEEAIFRAFNDAPAGLHVPVWLVMQAGSLGAVGVTAGGLLWRHRRREAVAAALTGTAVWAGVKAVKPTVGRGRPQRHLDDVRVRGNPQSGLGYPSGHAAVSLTLALIASHGQAPIVRAAAFSAAAVTGGARMYVGAHLPLDIAGGYAIGVICGQAANGLIHRDPTRASV